MTTNHSTPKQNERIRDAVWEDLRRKDLSRTLQRDVKELQAFFLDEERQNKLTTMNPVRRFFFRMFWLLRSLILFLTPVRRLLLLASLLFILTINSTVQENNVHLEAGKGIVAFIIVLFVLMLELKDKLLAHSELESGRSVQISLMPERSPSVKGWDIVLQSQPARQVGGDFVDFVRISDTTYGIGIGDVAGKGLAAALFATKIQATINALIDHLPSLIEFGSRINHILCRDGLPHRFSSLLFLALEPGNGNLRFVNAGHPAPFIVRVGGIERISEHDPALGLMPTAVYHEQTLSLDVGDVFLAFSDGLTEAQNDRGEFFSDTRIVNILQAGKGESAESIAQRLTSSLLAFIGEKDPTDDLSFVILRRIS
jgi:sigma-B regulation protein RsbU (phosphoserine phosphatase)